MIFQLYLWQGYANKIVNEKRELQPFVDSNQNTLNAPVQILIKTLSTPLASSILNLYWQCGYAND